MNGCTQRLSCRRSPGTIEEILHVFHASCMWLYNPDNCPGANEIVMLQAAGYAAVFSQSPKIDSKWPRTDKNGWLE